MIAFLLGTIAEPRVEQRHGSIRTKHDPQVIGIQTAIPLDVAPAHVQQVRSALSKPARKAHDQEAKT